MEMIAEIIRAILPATMQQKTYIGELPTDVDDCVAIAEQGGPFGTYFAKDKFNTPYAKIVVRNPKYLEGHNDALKIKQVLTSYTNHQEFGLVLVNDILYFGRDDKRRNMFQLTYKVFSYIGGQQ